MNTKIKAFTMLWILLPWPTYAVLSEFSFELPLLKTSMGKKIVSFVLPIPRNIIVSKASIELIANNALVDADFSILNTWPSSNDVNSIRLLHVKFSDADKVSKSFILRWNNTVEEGSKRSNIKSFLKGGQDSKNVHLVYPTLNWLSQSLLIHPKQNIALDWYIEPQKKYANYITNQSLLDKNGYPESKTTQWLYDRPQSIFQLFIMSGEKEWLIKANKLTDFYIRNIDDNGQFILKKQFDSKYLMPKGLMYHYLLSGDIEAKQALQRIFDRSLDWDEDYSLDRGFWTERNQAAALNVAVSYWEISHDKRALERINDIVNATVEMTFNPKIDWPLRGCPQHSFKSHEGWGDDSPTCSPWMMALLGDALWRFYQLTGDKRAASLIDAFGDFILNHGIYYGDKRVNNIVIPKYIVSIENLEQEELDQWTDPQHACDVAALLGKSAFIKQQKQQEGFLVKILFRALLDQCKQNYIKLKKQQNSNREKSYWQLKPPRRFGWMYSTTSDLPWLESLLLKDY